MYRKTPSIEKHLLKNLINNSFVTIFLVPKQLNLKKQGMPKKLREWWGND